MRRAAAMRRADVLVVGGSLAGASTALALARRGFTVLLVDRSMFPRRKPCGEGLSSLALAELELLGLSNKLFALPHHRFYGYRIIPPHRAPCVLAGGSEARGIGIERAVLDSLLFAEAASTPGITVLPGRKVTGAAVDRFGVRVDSGGERLSARTLVVADGAGSLIASRLEVPTLRPAARRYGISMIFEGRFTATPRYVQLRPEQSCEWYATAVSPSRLTISALGTKSTIAALRQRSAAREAVVPALCDAAEFCGEACEEPIICGPIGARRRIAAAGRVFLVGDACECLDPLAGMGMTHALVSARLAAAQIEALLHGRRSEEEAAARYRQAREQAVRPLRGFTRLSYLALRGLNPALLPFISESKLAAWVRNGIEPEPQGHAVFRSLLSAVGKCSLTETVRRSGKVA